MIVAMNFRIEISPKATFYDILAPMAQIALTLINSDYHGRECNTVLFSEACSSIFPY